MTGTESWFQGHLQELTREQCLELLETRSVGRVAFNTPDGPEVLPLNYVVHDESVVFRTSPHSGLGRQLQVAAAAFQVDDIDDYTESGWSVLLRGSVRPVEFEDLPPADRRPRTWVAGVRSLHLRLLPTTITGRRLLPG